MNSLLPRQTAIVALTLLALALGGATELWAQAIVAALAGVVILLAPPHYFLGRFPSILFLVFLALAAAAFLPASWATFPAWRQHLVDDLHVPLPSTHTAQPWVTLQACGLLFIGLVWAYYLLSQKWESDQRLAALRLLVLGVAILAAVSLVSFAQGWRVPGWNQEQNRGWFPNRNQTADVLALCGIVNYGLIFDRLRKSRFRGLFWLATLLPICAGLVICLSRAGILLFFIGIGLWHLWPAHHRKGSRNRIKWTALSLALGFFLLALFFLFGGETMERFQHRFDTPATPSLTRDYRVLLQKDAFRFSLQQPWLGVGLGNFEPLFAAARHASVDQNRAIHPESDWLWLAVEMGWPALLVVLAGVGWWFFSCFPFEPKQGESLRRAAAVAVGIFLLHGFIDVSGHRVGSVAVALLLASLGRSSHSEIPIPVLNLGTLGFRGLAGLMIALSAWWFASIKGASVFPTTAELARLEERSQAAAAAGQLDALESLATEEIRISPLDWTSYFQRARAEAYHPNRLPEAIADFQVARAIETHWVRVTFDEGSVWLLVNQPDLCLDAWKDAMHRDPANEALLYRRMTEQALAQDNPLVLEYLREFALEHKDCLSELFGFSSADDAKKTIADLLAADPDLQSLDPKQREDLFQMWWNRGDQADLIRQLLGHEDWQSTGWLYLAQFYAQQKDFQNAWATVARYFPAPAIPALASDRPVADLQRDFYSQPDNIASGLLLLLAQMKAGQTDDASVTIHVLEKLPQSPKYVFYLEAKTWADKQQWEQAWDTWLNFYTR